MQDEVIVILASHKRVPWNKGKLTGANPTMRLSNFKSYLLWSRREDVEMMLEGLRLAGQPE